MFNNNMFLTIGETSTSSIQVFYTVGENGNGQLGINDLVTQEYKVINDDSIWIDVAAGHSYSLFLKDDNTLWGCGSNNSGQLGLSGGSNRLTPVQLTTGVSKVFSNHTGSASFVVKTDGTLYSSGDNNFGQLGINTTIDTFAFTRETTLGTTWSTGASGENHSCFIKTDGTLHSTGYNFYGNLGVNDTTNRDEFTQESSLATNWSKVSAGTWFSVAIKTDGTMYSVGTDQDGRTGQGTNGTTDLDEFTQIGTDTNWAEIACGEKSVHAIKTDGTLWSWGDNSSGQLGHNDYVDRSTPTQVGADTTWSKVYAGRFHVFALKTDGTVWACGSNFNNQIRPGSTADVRVFTKIEDQFKNWSKIVGGGGHSIYLTNSFQPKV